MGSIYRKIARVIWDVREFQKTSIEEKLLSLYNITHNLPDRFDCFAGPMIRVASSPKRRPDLYSGEWRKIRKLVIKRDGTICTYCRQDCADDPTIDHIRAVSLGGKMHDMKNLVVSCRRCNSKKGGREGWIPSPIPHPQLRLN